jgi:RNase P subunit RPR2
MKEHHLFTLWYCKKCNRYFYGFDLEKRYCHRSGKSTMVHVACNFGDIKKVYGVYDADSNGG